MDLDKKMADGDIADHNGHRWTVQRIRDVEKYTDSADDRTWRAWLMQKGGNPNYQKNDLTGAKGKQHWPYFNALVVVYVGFNPTSFTEAGKGSRVEVGAYVEHGGRYHRVVRAVDGLRCASYFQPEAAPTWQAWLGTQFSRKNPIEEDGAWYLLKSAFNAHTIAIVSTSEPPPGAFVGPKVGEEILVSEALKHPGMLVEPVGFGRDVRRFRVSAHPGTWQVEGLRTGDIDRPAGNALKQTVRVVQVGQRTAEESAIREFVGTEASLPAYETYPSPVAKPVAPVGDFFTRYQVVPGKPTARPAVPPHEAPDWEKRIPFKCTLGQARGLVGARVAHQKKDGQTVARVVENRKYAHTGYFDVDGKVYSGAYIFTEGKRAEDREIWVVGKHVEPPFDSTRLAAMSCFCLSWSQALSVASGAAGGFVGRGSDYSGGPSGKGPSTKAILGARRAHVLGQLDRWNGPLNSHHQRHNRSKPGPLPSIHRLLDAIAG